MKLPMLFKSLFDIEPESPAPEATLAPERKAEPRTEPEPPQHDEPEPQPLPEDAVKRHADPLLDGIDTLGDIVLALDAQLRAERFSSQVLRHRLNDELAALSKVLR